VYNCALVFLSEDVVLGGKVREGERGTYLVPPAGCGGDLDFEPLAVTPPRSLAQGFPLVCGALQAPPDEICEPGHRNMERNCFHVGTCTISLCLPLLPHHSSFTSFTVNTSLTVSQ